MVNAVGEILGNASEPDHFYHLVCHSLNQIAFHSCGSWLVFYPCIWARGSLLRVILVFLAKVPLRRLSYASIVAVFKDYLELASFQFVI